MSFDGSNPCWVPTVPVTLDRKFRVKTTAFGDGYEQHTLDGINALGSSWSLQWDNRPSSDLIDMDAFLSNQGVAPFQFRDPASELLYWVVCDNWQIAWSPRRRQAGAWIYYGSMSAEFRKANGASI
jgi:phage-related protein